MPVNVEECQDKFLVLRRIKDALTTRSQRSPSSEIEDYLSEAVLAQYNFPQDQSQHQMSELGPPISVSMSNIWSQAQPHPNIAQCFPKNSQLWNIVKFSLSPVNYLINYCTESPEVTIQMIKQPELKRFII